MNAAPVMKIISLCRQMDETARDLYATFSKVCQDEQLQTFWQQMSRDESAHVQFWLKAEQLETLPCSIFNDPDKIINELEHSIDKIDSLMMECSDSYSVANMFILSYRIEFSMLHSAFETLFQLFRPMEGVSNPGVNYDSHIAGFIEAFAKFGKVTPELELLGETLMRLWKENRALARQATLDELTGLLNRRGFFATAGLLAHLSQRNQSTVGVLMIDIDFFRTVNDRLGHWGGDLVLKGVARIISGSLRFSDLLGRYGGEEFIVLLPATGTAKTSEVAKKIRTALESTMIEGLSLTLSIGFAEGTMGTAPQDDLQALIRNADAALYQAKNSGRNVVVEYRELGAMPHAGGSKG
jgi:diguanylate cyclase (GGDEF)-like protein